MNGAGNRIYGLKMDYADNQQSIPGALASRREFNNCLGSDLIAVGTAAFAVGFACIIP
jgi:hypothetical protein